MKLQDWLHADKLSRNLVETQSIDLSSALYICMIESWSDVQFYFSIGEQKIEMITNVRYFGVRQSTQVGHIDTSKTKTNRTLGLIRYSKKHLPPGTQQIYRVIIDPHLRYCCSLLGCCSERENPK